MLPKLLAWFFILSSPLTFAATLTLGTRYHAAQKSDFINHSVRGYFELHPSLVLDPVFRLTHRLNTLEDTQYKGELKWRALSFLYLGFRVSHAIYWKTPRAMSHLFPYAHIRTRAFGRFELTGTIGWYERFITLTGSNVIPVFLPDRYYQHDIGVNLGFRYFFKRSLSSALFISTIDDIAIYNLNNPYIEARGDFVSFNWGLAAFLRYQILLGFGRLDQIVFGAEYKFRI